METVITQEQLCELTGYKEKADLVACLSRQGVVFLRGKRGRIFTTTTALNLAMGATPDFQVKQAVQEIEF